MARTPARSIAHLLGIIHNVTYYAEEMAVFKEHGIANFWHSYIAYRSAPMGRLEPPAITAAFFNFAPAVVEAAVPSVWEHVTPASAMQLRDDAVASALERGIEATELLDEAGALADVVLEAVRGLSGAARPLYGAHDTLPIPDAPLMRLWHAATLWREYRGDGHNVALAFEDIDGIECHVLLAGKGVADQAIIQRIRGWTLDEWNAAHGRLEARGLVRADGLLTDDGASLRRHIEDQTDRLADAPLVRLGEGRASALIDGLEPLVDSLLTSGIVPARWPPPQKNEPSSGRR